MTDHVSKEARSRIMSSIRSKNTKTELSCAKLMWNAGLRYQKQATDLPGKPDFIFRSKKVAIFVDGDFWHGWQYPKLREKLRNEYWIKKIENNRKRDRKNHSALRKKGWKVVRIWEHQLKNQPNDVLTRIIQALNA